MLLKHKENELKQTMATSDRFREDFMYRLQESLDKQQDRYIMEKQQDIEGINQRNEALIKQLVESHNQELRNLREQMFKTDRLLRDKEIIISSLEFKLKHGSSSDLTGNYN